MIGCVRPEAPDVLREHGEAWGRDFAERRRAEPAYRFQWRSHAGERVNARILPALRAMTAGHCAYCDGFPIDVTAYETIDHFRPKATFPELAYTWTNLFLACERCQGLKGETWDDALLRPDDGEYRFDRYFLVDVATGRIEVNPAAPPADSARAERTIAVLGLNEGSRPADRRRWLRLARDFDVDDRPYRFLPLAG